MGVALCQWFLLLSQFFVAVCSQVAKPHCDTAWQNTLYGTAIKVHESICTHANSWDASENTVSVSSLWGWSWCWETMWGCLRCVYKKSTISTNDPLMEIGMGLSLILLKRTKMSLKKTSLKKTFKKRGCYHGTIWLALPLPSYRPSHYCCLLVQSLWCHLCVLWCCCCHIWQHNHVYNLGLRQLSWGMPVLRTNVNEPFFVCIVTH